MFEQQIPVNYESSSNLIQIDSWLRELDTHPEIALDFETAIRYTAKDLELFQSIVDSPTSTKLEKRIAKSKLTATALDHPSHSTITHLSAAWSESDARVFIINSPKILNRILYWLTTTDTTQIWHNASYDMSRIYYYTHKFPKNYEDTQLFAKTILNHVETYKAKTGLKELAGHKFGDWGISTDNFTLNQQFDPNVLRYAATDACATYWLWNSIQTYLKQTLMESGV